MDAYRAQLQSFDPDIANAIRGEERRQSDGVEMIPAENYTYPEVLAALGSVLTNKYSEGYPGRRYYGGQEYTDMIENIARDRACTLFRAEHANVQPLSGSPMNQACYFAFLEPGRHSAGDGPFAWRSPDAWSAGFAHGQGIQLRALQECTAAGRRYRLQGAYGRRKGDPA